jgi:molecular chaperone DnaK
VPADVKSDVEEKVAAVRDALKTDDTEKIKSASEALRQSSIKIGEAMYKADQATQAEATQPEGEPAGATAGTDGAKKDDTIEGEFKEQS